MSKSMWIPTEGDNLPVSDSDKPMFSIDVLFWVAEEDAPRWGYLNFHNATYIDDTTKEYFPADYVKYFAYIDNPYK